MSTIELRCARCDAPLMETNGDFLERAWPNLWTCRNGLPHFVRGRPIRRCEREAGCLCYNAGGAGSYARCPVHVAVPEQRTKG